jgi:DNA repair exonuclease SbcCD ATPase subunit
MSEENEKKDNKPFCGLGKPPKGRKRGNMLECLERKQVKFYGRNKIDPKLIEHSLRLQKTLKEKNDVIIVVSKLRGKLKNIIRKIQGEKDEEKKNKLKVMGREVRDQLLEQEKLFDSILKKEKKAEKRKKKEDVIEKSSKEKAKKLEKKVNKLEEEMDETIKKMKKEKNMDTKLLELKLKKIEDELKKTKEEAKKKVQIVKDKVELKAKKKAHLEAKKEAKKKVNKLEKEMDETIKKMKDEKHLDTKPLELKLKKIDDELKKTKVETKKKVQIAEDEFAKKEKEIADAIKEGIRKKKEKEAKKARKKERPTNVSHYLDDTFGDDAEKVRDILIKIMSCMLESKNYITTFLDLGGTGPKGEFVERKLEQFERNIIKYLPFFSELAGVDITEGEMHDGSEGSDGMHDGSYVKKRAIYY